MQFFKKILQAFLGQSGGGSRIQKIRPDDRVVQLLNYLMSSLQLPNEAERMNGVLNCVHPSMTYAQPDGSLDLDRSVKEFSYKKAVQAAQLYSNPVQITEVHKGTVQTVGAQGSGTRGRVDKYFVAKQDGVQGLPAPIHVLTPEDGSHPRVINFGSL